jgi:hypothetical protein
MDRNFAFSKYRITALLRIPSQRTLFVAITLIWLLISSISAQDFPKKIRGYKVQIVKSVPISPNSNGTEAPEKINIKKVEVADYSLTGITLKMQVELHPVDAAGKVDFITFNDFAVDGVPVDIEEYREQFSFDNGKPIVLPGPVTVFIRTDRVIATAWKQTHQNEPKLKITGRAFVFGKFRKYGLSFKRVVPVDMSFSIPNPLFKPENPSH